MERLTEWRNGHGAIINNRENYIDKLAQYEDAEESGLLVRLPCKVGDTVYMLWPCGKKKGIATLDILHIDMDNALDISVSAIARAGSGTYRKIDTKQIGKTVFLTREEAEKALEAKR